MIFLGSIQLQNLWIARKIFYAYALPPTWGIFIIIFFIKIESARKGHFIRVPPGAPFYKHKKVESARGGHFIRVPPGAPFYKHKKVESARGGHFIRVLPGACFNSS